MHDIITVDDTALSPGEEREVTVSIVESDLENSGGALIGLQEDGSSDTLEIAQGEIVLGRGRNHCELTHDGEKFIITVVND
ncbi:MAG: hypothetical protein ACOX2Q_11045 [Dehalobacterium sp.]|jgi:hypothetical protein